MELYKDRNTDEIFLSVKTESMGSCRCGDCYCDVFPNGDIRYSGGESWQRSERISGAEALKPRPYHSELGASGFNAAMEEFRRLFKKCGDSVFTKIGIDPALSRLIQIKDGKMRYLENSWRRNKKGKSVRWNNWTEWQDLPTLKYLSGNDIAYRFAARVARGEITFPNFEARFGNNS